MSISIKYKLLTAFLALTLTILIISGTAYYFRSQAALEQKIFDALNATSQVQKHRIEDWIDHNKERLSLITSRTQLRISLKEFLTNANADALKKIHKIIHDATQSIVDVDAIHITNLHGKVIASTRKSAITQNFNDQPVFEQGKTTNNANTIDLTQSRGRLLLSGPLLLGDELLGVLIVEEKIRTLQNISQDYTGLGETGETIIVVQTENTIKSVNPVRFLQGRNAPSILINPFHYEDQTTLQVSDYRNIPVLAIVKKIKGTSWGMVVKIDRDEAFAPLSALRNFLLLSILFSLLLASLTAFLLSAFLTKPIIDMTEVASLIARGNLKKRIEKMSRDELGVLAKAFNLMADKLIEANQTLETRVRKKTEQLEEANSSLVEKNEQLSRLSQTDSLTGIANRRLFDKTIEAEWRRSNRSKKPVSLLILDIDCFKAYNDTKGHQTGDDCLIQVAKIISAQVHRAGDLVARYGGEEFGIILPICSLEEALKIAEAIRISIEKAAIEHSASNILNIVSVSIGVSSLVGRTDIQPDTLISQADQALYKAKKAGRNCVRAFEDDLKRD